MITGERSIKGTCFLQCHVPVWSSLGHSFKCAFFNTTFTSDHHQRNNTEITLPRTTAARRHLIAQLCKSCPPTCINFLLFCFNVTHTHFVQKHESPITFKYASLLSEQELTQIRKRVSSNQCANVSIGPSTFCMDHVSRPRGYRTLRPCRVFLQDIT